MQFSGKTIWLTGLSGAGKSTLSSALKAKLGSIEGAVSVVLDGDGVRKGLCKDLGFGNAARYENIRRSAEVARILNAEGIWVIAAFISPTKQLRELAREIIGVELFHEVYLSTSLSICEERDPKGLYRKARRGEIVGFTGIDAPYEPPLSPSLILDTSSMTINECVLSICRSVGL